jgi:hypothetical protein
MGRFILCCMLLALAVSGCDGESEEDKGADMSADMGAADLPTVVTDNATEFLSLKALLTYYRKPGCVDYRSMRDDPEARVLLASAARVFKDHPASELTGQDARLAYWINAYNTFMLQAVVDNYDLFARDTVLAEIGGERIFSKKLFEASGQVLSLDMLEQGILRRDSARVEGLSGAEKSALDALSAEVYGDGAREVRIHFAANCAAKGCPALAEGPYLAGTLEAQLEAQTTAFLNDAAKGAGPNGTSELLTSYYTQDFVDAAGSLDAYVKGYNADADTTKALTYNWALAQCEP